MKSNIEENEFGEIALRLRAVRAIFGYNQRDFALGANVEPKSYSQWESGKFRISINGAIRLRERYGLSLDFIYCGSLVSLPHGLANKLILGQPANKKE